MITVVSPSYFWPETTLNMLPYLMEHVERCGRICYKSEERITEGSAEKFVGRIRQNRHLSVLEHATITAVVICSRAASHQLVRHRIASFSQESQRYCNYKRNFLRVICPPSIGLTPGDYPACGTNSLTGRQLRWMQHIESAYHEYKCELAEGVKPEDARYVLPNATKTELAVTFNLRQWRHVFVERALNKHAQWEIRGIFQDILEALIKKLPAVFADLGQQSSDEAAIDVLKALFEVRDLGDVAYDIRERYGEGWDGPLVTKWSDAVTRARKLLDSK